jgi:heat shock protein HslJ
MTKKPSCPLHFLLSSILVLVAVLGCGPAAEETGSPTASQQQPSTETLSTEAPTMDELASATFAGIMEEPVELTDGHWQGEPFVEGGASAPGVGLVRHFHLTGDMTGDGSEEAIVLLWASSGGSGTFDHLAVSGHTDEGIATLGSAEVGDRVQIRGGRVTDGRITLDVLQAGPEDAACCPTQLATRVWEMGPAGLAETSSEVTGTMSLAELQGPEWILTDFAWNQAAPAEPEVTLVFEEGKIAGKAGCNGYFGGIEEGGDMPSGLSIGPIGATRMMCPEEIMKVEDRFLRQLAAATSYSYIAGRLALSWQNDDAAGVMIFAPREPFS